MNQVTVPGANLALWLETTERDVNLFLAGITVFVIGLFSKRLPRLGGALSRIQPQLFEAYRREGQSDLRHCESPL